MIAASGSGQNAPIVPGSGGPRAETMAVSCASPIRWAGFLARQAVMTCCSPAGMPPRSGSLVTTR